MSDFPEMASETKSTLLSKIFTFRNGFIFAVLVCLFVAGATLKASPEYSLYRLNQALVNRDIETFNYYFDKEAVVDQLVSDAYADAHAAMNLKMAEESAKPMNVWERMGSEIGKGLAVAIVEASKPVFKEAASKFIDDNVHSIMISSESKEMPRYSIKEIKKQGKISFATILNETNNIEIKLVLQNQPQGYWKVISIDYKLFKKANNS